MRRFSLFFVVTALCSLAVANPSFAKKPGAGTGYTLVGTGAALVHPGDNSQTAVQLWSSGSGSSLIWGAIGFAVPSKMTFSDVNNLSTDYKFVQGSCWQGSPRFTVGISNGTPNATETWFYIGPSPSYTGCPSGVWSNTGNLASPTSPVDDSALPGGSPTDTFAGAQAKYGSYSVNYIAIDVDGGAGGNQTVDFDNTRVNSTLYTYEP
jgi:hypothetical protein